MAHRASIDRHRGRPGGARRTAGIDSKCRAGTLPCVITLRRHGARLWATGWLLGEPGTRHVEQRHRLQDYRHEPAQRRHVVV